MVDDTIKPAIRTALRFHEIGNDTPYRISFAGKGKSGGSFGFMQGDLAAGQPDVTRTFRDAMTAAGMSAQKINDLLALLAKHQIKNPLSPIDTAAVNQALQASHALVDAMDDKILEDVYRDLDRCNARAAAHQRSIETKASVYMALWINMSGPPTKLLTWLDGDDPHLARHVPPAGSVVSGDDMEDYLAATNYYVENPQNLKHLHDCAARGMRALDTTFTASQIIAAAAATIDAAASVFTEAAATDTVTIAAKSDGRDYTVSIRKTGPSSGTIQIGEVQDSPASYDVSAIRARADGTKLTCKGPMGTTIACSLRAGHGPVTDGIEISVRSFFGTDVSVYTTPHPDFERLKTFIGGAGFPALEGSGPALMQPTVMAAKVAVAEPQPAPPSASTSITDAYVEATKAIELWRLQKSPDDYDSRVDPLIRNAARAVGQSPNADEIAKWLDIQASARGIADPEITATTLRLRDTASQEFAAAFTQLSKTAQRYVTLELGDRPDDVRTELASLPSSAAMLDAADTTNLLGTFVAEGLFMSARGHPVLKGALTLKDRHGAALGVYHVNTGGGAPDFRTTNGPIPPGIYRLSNYRARSTDGMVLNGVGYSFDLDPIHGTRVFGRSLFRLHPDGGSPQTNGCLGVRPPTDVASQLQQCRDRLRSLVNSGRVEVSVSYGSWMT